MRWIARALVLLVLLLPATVPLARAQDSDWSLVYSRNDDRVADIAMFDDLFGLAQSGYGVLRTVDGGRTWTEPPSRPVIGYGVIGFADRDHAWITGTSGIWRTDDAGLNWRRQAGGAGPSSASIAVINADEAWITGAASNESDLPSFTYPANKLMHTVDSGVTWTPVELPQAGRYFSVQFVGRDGWVTASQCNPGDAQSVMGDAPVCPDTTILFHSGDGGATWSIVAREPDVPVIPRKVRFVVAGVLAAVAFASVPLLLRRRRSEARP